ncbi:polycystic kidney disease 1 like 1 [Myxocyprinus asiaticus]|uniref:polycystic kidney disease 1 like 1 n=1 Tax=Myxocyprinus asiaticus TaxID=70543 RepID=UPI0022216D10|nr:polycystic kidney disease 1 like 1 [Myxocyprinus asiaticus]
MSVMAIGYLTFLMEAVLPAAGLYRLDVNVINSIYTQSTIWWIRACPSGAEYLNLMLSKRDQDIPSCAPLSTEIEDRQQEKASTKFIHNHKRGVWIYSDKQAYATEADVTFVAVTELPDPLYFHWRFGDGPEIQTTSRTFTKRYHVPDKYNVTVHVSVGLTSVSSDIYPVMIQRAVLPNRLLFSPSVLLNSSVSFTCRISSGTDVFYLWKFGDGTERDGSNTEHHVFNRTGEYIVEVIMFNLVSSASMTGQIFVVEESCQPPPVKNMGPNKIQVWRYQSVRLAVTFETQIQCNVSRSLLYKWTVYDSSGQQLLLPHTETERQYIELPKYILHYGTYKAIAKVQVAGNVVYSNYSVLIEVILSHPVSVISEATNIFINRQNDTIVTLDGRKSHDPDYPNNTISYSWSCRPVNTEESSCFNRNILTTSAVLTFPAHVLKPGFDLFKVTLTVYSGHRSSSSEMFISITSKVSRNIHLSCKPCQENAFNWNEQFSVSALCENCGYDSKNVTHYWKLYLVNASSKVVTEVPFCSIMDLDFPSKMEDIFHPSQNPVVTPYTPAHLSELSVPVSLAPSLLSNAIDPTASVTQDALTPVIHTKPNVHFLTASPTTNTFKHAALLTTTPSHPLSFLTDAESSGFQWEYQGSLPPAYGVSSTDVISEYDYYNYGIEEADPGVPIGRPTEVDSVGFSWNEDSFPHSHDHEGDNLVDPSLLDHAVYEKTLLDLHRQPIHPAVFESYTLTGLSSWVVTFKPFMLKPKSLYMLEVFASSGEWLWGKSQLFFHTQAVPEGMSCQVQPSTGFEIHTHFSIFCSSGKEDLLYEYSFSVGNSQRRVLYEGRDFQHYFRLPSGDPKDDHKVTIYIKIKNRFGAPTKPCPVTVTVLPSFQRNSSSQLNPDQELYIYGIGNLTSLSIIRSNRDILSFISLLSTVLNRLSLDQESSVELLTLTRTALISAVCELTITDQGVLFEIISRLTDLIQISSQVTLDSAKQVTQHVQGILSLFHESKLPAGNIVDIGMVNALVTLLSGVLEASVLSSRPGPQLIHNALNTISDLVLRNMLSSNVTQYSVSTSFMELLAWKDDQSYAMVKTFGLTTFHLTDFLEMQFHQWSRNDQHKPCVITWLTVYKQSPYRWTRASMQLSGETADIRLYNCTSRKEIKVRHLSTPVTIEFERKEEIKSRHTEFTLLHSQVNTHQFNVTPQILQRALQITVRFNRPAERPFPILLLLRLYDQPTPNLYNKQKVYSWKGQTAHIFLHSSSLHAAGSVYLMLLSADYNKSPSNKYIANAVNYTLDIESVECLSWDSVREWKPSGCFPHGGVSPKRILCSCNHLASLAVSHQRIINSYKSADVSQFIHSNTNYTLIIVSVIFLVLYMVMLVICRKADASKQNPTGSFLLPENNPSDQFLYAVTIDTGFRSRIRMTAKVHIVLYGEESVSQTRELSSPDLKVFTCNSRSTFIFSTPESLGRVWKVHLWHDNGGSSPNWYLSHVVVRDLVKGSCWFFLGQCWLAVDEGDGKVERSLTGSECGLTFKQFLYLKLTEYLEDFHPWLSVYSRPSYSTYTHAQRSSVCMLLLQGYMFVSAVLVYLWEEQHFLEMGLIDVSPVSMVTGLCSSLAVMPVGCLVSLVFRVSKTSRSKGVSEEQYKIKVPQIYSVEDHHDALMNDCAFESYMSRNTVSHGTQGSWTKENKYGTPNRKTSDSVSASKLQGDSDSIFEIVEDSLPDVNNRSHDKSKWNQSDLRPCTSAENQQVCGGQIRSLRSWCYYVGWTLCLSISLACIILTGTLGKKFSKTKSLMWVHSVFFSFVCCGFVLHPAMILIIAIIVSLMHRKKTDWFQSLSTGALSGAYSLIGSPVIRKIESSYNSSCQILNLMDKNNNRCSIVHSVGADLNSSSHNQSVSNAHFLCGKFRCYDKGKIVSINLEKTRSKMVKLIKNLQATGWMTPFTHIVMIQLILYNAPSNLFTSTTILLEQTPIGALIPSVSVQSTRLYHFPAVLDYCVMTCEVTVIICSLFHYICSVYLFVLKTEMIHFLQRGDFKSYVDLSPIFLCEQLSQSLLGIVVGFLLLKCVLFLRLNKAVAAAVSTLKQIFSNLLCLLVSGVIVAVAFSCLWTLIFHSFPSTLSSFMRSVYLVYTRSFSMSRFSEIDHQTKVPLTLYFGVLFCTMIPLKAMVISTLTIFAKQTKRTKMIKHLTTIYELISYVKDMALLLIGKGNHKTADHPVHTTSLYLAEFEDLMDELLFHLSAMSDSLHNTLPVKENLFETQSNFSFLISQHGHSSDYESADFDVNCLSSQKMKHRRHMDMSCVS